MKQGFTVIELLIVIAVISILISITVPRMEGMRDEANQVKARAEKRALAAIESHYLNQTPHEYPASTDRICETVLNDASPLIIHEVLSDPFSTGSREYRYVRSNNEKYFVVFSVGPDARRILRELTIQEA